MNWKSWAMGLFYAIAAGVGGGLTFALTDPEHFNFGNGGGKHLLSLSAAFGLLAAGSYLKDSRPPSWKDSIPTVAEVKKSVGVGLVLLACALVASACSLSLKQQAVGVLQVSETALEVSHDAERRLCAPLADQTKGIGHCDGAQAIALGLTDDIHAKTAAFYSRAFDLQIKAAAAAKLWRAGDPVPSDVLSYRIALTDILNALKAIIPAEQTVMTKLQVAIDAAADLLKLAGVK